MYVWKAGKIPELVWLTAKRRYCETAAVELKLDRYIWRRDAAAVELKLDRYISFGSND